MAVTIQLPAEQEAALQEQARAQGLTVEAWLLDLAARAIDEGFPAAAPTGRQQQPANLSELLLHSPFAGADLNLERLVDYPRPVDLE